MAQNLTIKERKFIKAMMSHGNVTQAVIDAGYKHKDRDSASVIGWHTLRKLRPHIADVMEMRGITDAKLSNVLFDGLEASKIGMVKDADGNQKFGMVTDHFVRHKFLDTALKVKGGYAPEKHDVSGSLRLGHYRAQFGDNGENGNGNGNGGTPSLYPSEKPVKSIAEFGEISGDQCGEKVGKDIDGT